MSGIHSKRYGIRTAGLVRRIGTGLWRIGVTQHQNKMILLPLLLLLASIYYMSSTVMSPLAGANESFSIVDEIDQTPSINNKVLAASMKRDHGNGWNVLNWDDKAMDTGEYTCKWTEFKSFSTGNKAQMCIHNFPDIVSGAISSSKRWNDCNPLPRLWEAAERLENSIYVEIGANIGACVMEMLLSTDAKIIAFEPHPRNQFTLWSTISRLDKSLRDRVVVFPIALGSEEGSSTIYSAKDNMGNSVVGKIVKDYDAQKFSKSEEHTVQIERLDSVLKTDSLHVQLMKLDAQGFECKILEGCGWEIAQYIETVSFEYSKKWLDAQNCMDLLATFRRLGFEIQRSGGSIVAENPSKDNMDLLAKRKTF